MEKIIIIFNPRFIKNKIFSSDFRKTQIFLQIVEIDLGKNAKVNRINYSERH